MESKIELKLGSRHSALALKFEDAAITSIATEDLSALLDARGVSQDSRHRILDELDRRRAARHRHHAERKGHERHDIEPEIPC